MSTFTKKSSPVTKTGEEGSSKRNILRKGAPVTSRKDEVAGDPFERGEDGTLNPVVGAVDSNDPNYDSEDDNFDGFATAAAAVAKSQALSTPSLPNPAIQKLTRLPSENSVGKSQMTLQEYKTLIPPIIKEFLVNGDIQDAIDNVECIGTPAYSFEFVKRCISISCDAHDRERERVSRLINAGYPKTFSSFAIGKAFERLFEQVKDLTKDCPTAPELLSTFLARAIVDEVLPPSFLTDPIVMKLGGEIVERAKLMLVITTGPSGADMERIWGPGDGRPVEEMKQAVDQLLLEYLSSADLAEACRCIKELNAPEFMHEIVKRAITCVLAKGENSQQAMSNMFIYMIEQDILTIQQASKGFHRLYDRLDDLILDVPTAGTTLAMFTSWAIEENILPVDFKFNKEE